LCWRKVLEPRGTGCFCRIHLGGYVYALYRAVEGWQGAYILVDCREPALWRRPGCTANGETWLKPGWQAVDAEPEVLALQNIPDKKSGSITVRFSDDSARVTAFQEWMVLRAKWAEAERPAVVALRIFERVHALWTARQREGDRVELALADGMLWVSDQFIRRPVLSQRVSLAFDTILSRV
jgi:hypothetical protein